MYDVIALLIVVAAAGYAFRRYALGAVKVFLRSNTKGAVGQVNGRGAAFSLIEVRADAADTDCSSCSTCAGCRAAR